jgi:hypothetical protein
VHVCGQGEQYLEQGECEEGIDGPAQPQSAMIANQCRPGQKGKRGQIRHRLVRGCEWREKSHSPREERSQAFHHEAPRPEICGDCGCTALYRTVLYIQHPRQTPGSTMVVSGEMRPRHGYDSSMPRGKPSSPPPSPSSPLRVPSATCCYYTCRHPVRHLGSRTHGRC